MVDGPEAMIMGITLMCNGAMIRAPVARQSGSDAKGYR